MTAKEQEEQSVDRIIEAALSEFADHGFSGARMDRIADRADVNKATIYYHIGKKEQLHKRVLLEKFELIGERFDEVCRRFEDDTDPVEEKFKTMLTELADVVVEQDYYRMMMSDIVIGDRELPEEVFKQSIENIERLRDVFEEGRESGVFRDTSLLTVYLIFIATLTFYSSMGSTVEDAARHFDEAIGPASNEQPFPPELFDILFQGILTNPESADD